MLVIVVYLRVCCYICACSTLGMGGAVKSKLLLNVICISCVHLIVFI